MLQTLVTITALPIVGRAPPNKPDRADPSRDPDLRLAVAATTGSICPAAQWDSDFLP